MNHPLTKNKPLTPEEQAQTLRTLEVIDARLLALLKLRHGELVHVKDKKTPPAVRVKLLTFIPILIAAGTQGCITPEDFRFWIDNELGEITGKPSVPFPFARHRRLLETLVIRGCLQRGEITLEDTVEDRSRLIEDCLRLDEGEYRRRFGDAAYFRLIEQGETQNEQADEKAA